MGCGCGNKNAHAKSCVRYYNNNAQAIAAGENTLQLVGARAVDSGISIQAEPMSYDIVKAGLYHIVADLTLTATTGGLVTLEWYLDGVPLPCTFRQVTAVADVSEPMHTETELAIGGCCCDINKTLTLVLTAATGVVATINQLCTGVLKLA